MVWLYHRGNFYARKRQDFTAAEYHTIRRVQTNIANKTVGENRHKIIYANFCLIFLCSLGLVMGEYKTKPTPLEKRSRFAAF